MGLLGAAQGFRVQGLGFREGFGFRTLLFCFKGFGVRDFLCKPKGMKSQPDLKPENPKTLNPEAPTLKTLNPRVGKTGLKLKDLRLGFGV